MRRLTKLAMVCTVSMYILFRNGISAHAEPVLQIGYTTAYCQTGTMSNGQQTRLGVCAGSKVYKDAMIVLYQRLPDGSLGDYIGMYECLDTGSTDGIKNGTVIDVWQPNLEECQDFMDVVYQNECQGNVYIQVIEGKG